MKKTLIIIFSIIICFLVGYISSRFQIESLANWYPTLNKSILTPPNWAFPVAWSILYLLMGLSIGLILCCKTSREGVLLKLFIIQLFLNFTWSIVFFYFQNPMLGMINIILLDIFIILYAVKAYSSSKISSLLFIPYILWVSFAAYLNLYILLNN